MAVVAEVDGHTLAHDDTAADWAAVRSEAFPDFGEDNFRHLTTAAFSDTVSVLPPEENPFGAFALKLRRVQAATSFLTLEEAREFVREVGLKDHTQWEEWCREAPRPSNITSRRVDGGEFAVRGRRES